MFRPIHYAALGGALLSAPLFAADCSQVPNAAQLQQLVQQAPNKGGDEGGLFHGKQEWAAVVNRAGQVCAVAASQSGMGMMWPGSLPIAKAKAYTPMPSARTKCRFRLRGCTR